MNNKLKLLLLTSLIFMMTLVNQAHAAARVHGALGSLVVLRNEFWVTFDNNYSGCGDSRFHLSKPDWNDIVLLAKAVQSSQVVLFDYECNGNSNWITHFELK